MVADSRARRSDLAEAFDSIYSSSPSPSVTTPVGWMYRWCLPTSSLSLPRSGFVDQDTRGIRAGSSWKPVGDTVACLSTLFDGCRCRSAETSRDLMAERLAIRAEAGRRNYAKLTSQEVQEDAVAVGRRRGVYARTRERNGRARGLKVA